LIFGDGRDEGAFVRCMAGCATASVIQALDVAGTGTPLTPEELARRRAADEADRDARIERARARYEAGLVHPDRLRALEWVSGPLKWNAADLFERDVGWDGGRVVFPIVDERGNLQGVDRYAPPGSPLRETGPKLIAHGMRGLWPAPARTGSFFLVEGCPAAATVLAAGLPAVAYPSASGLRRVDGERLRTAGGAGLIVLADNDAVGRRAAQTSVLVLRDLGVRAYAVDLFNDIDDDSRDVADEFRARNDGAEWLIREIEELQLGKERK
jgi:hypothetical protein